jgi:Family of unknown function (DUF6527)
MMARLVRIKHEFVEFIPKERQDGVLYISIPYATAVHNCFCGCGLKVVTPISPVGWKLIFDGESVTLFPSIGSWRFPCRSHYFIRGGAVVWSWNMNEEDIEWGRVRDQKARDQYFGTQTVERTEIRKKKRASGTALSGSTGQPRRQS